MVAPQYRVEASAAPLVIAQILEDELVRADADTLCAMVFAIRKCASLGAPQPFAEALWELLVAGARASAAIVRTTETHGYAPPEPERQRCAIDHDIVVHTCAALAQVDATALEEAFVAPEALALREGAMHSFQCSVREACAAYARFRARVQWRSYRNLERDAWPRAALHVSLYLDRARGRVDGAAPPPPPQARAKDNDDSGGSDGGTGARTAMAA